MGIILSCFKGIGKTYLENTKGKEAKILDLSNLSSKESSFIETIASAINENDIVFVSSHEDVRNILNENNIDYDLFYPSKNRRNEFIENEVRKHTNSSEIRNLDRYFETEIESIEEDESKNCFKHCLSGFGEFLGNNPILLTYIGDLNKKEIKRENE